MFIKGENAVKEIRIHFVNEEEEKIISTKQYYDVVDTINAWLEHYWNTLNGFYMKIEKKMQYIYSFEKVVVALDNAIEKMQNSSELVAAIVDGAEIEASGKNEVNVKVWWDERAMYKCFFQKQWNQLSRSVFSEVDRKNYNVPYKKMMKMNYSRYRGFIRQIICADKNGVVHLYVK